MERLERNLKFLCEFVNSKKRAGVKLIKQADTENIKAVVEIVANSNSLLLKDKQLVKRLVKLIQSSTNANKINQFLIANIELVVKVASATLNALVHNSLLDICQT